MPSAALISVASWLPEARLTNADLEQLVDTSDEWIRSRTGIAERRIAAPGDATSDLAARAGAIALERAGVRPADIDLLVVATSTPDMVFPSTACLAQAKIGLTCPAYDLNAACTGFIYAIEMATAMIESGRARTIMVIGADVLSSIVDYTDRSTCILFGDGAGAVVLQASEEPGVLSVHLGADGTGADLLYVPAGGSAAPVTPENLAAGDTYLKMNGNEVFKFAVRAIPGVTKQALADSGLTTDDVDWLIPHQANQRITDTVAQRLGIAHERVVCRIEDIGNTSAASIPIALDSLYRDGRLRAGNILALVGFGAGLTYGAAIVRWTRED
ncbi:MAG TPA: beta-ketoacyl-ACP synthase III [Coriobacteriia bacterium]